MKKCPPNVRTLRPFNVTDTNRALLAIPMIEHIPYESGEIVRPHKIFDSINGQCSDGWFLTKTYLFPKISEQVGWDQSGYPQVGQTLLLSFENDEDAVLAQMHLPTTVLLPSDWWNAFVQPTFRRHPIYAEFETAEIGLVKVNGQLRDISPSDSLEITSRSQTPQMPRCGWNSESIRRTVYELVQDTWSIAPSSSP